MDTSSSPLSASDRAKERQRDLVAFLFLTVILVPVLAVAIVGGFGFIVWIFQMFAGPPGPPGG